EAVLPLPLITAVMKQGGVSTQPKNYLTMHKEYLRASNHHFGTKHGLPTKYLVKAGVIMVVMKILGEDAAIKLINWVAKRRRG
ncbi:MAG: hypothetical protein ACRCTY_00640, partial [Candidatus Adiutrix sp.]